MKVWVGWSVYSMMKHSSLLQGVHIRFERKKKGAIWSPEFLLCCNLLIFHGDDYISGSDQLEHEAAATQSTFSTNQL